MVESKVLTINSRNLLRIIWQFGLGLLLAYLIPLASVSIQIMEDGKPLKNNDVQSIFSMCHHGCIFVFY